MSTLIVQLPAQPRLSVQQGAAASATPVELTYVFSADGLQPSRHGRALPADLPRAQSTVAVLPPAELGWHRLTAPKAPPARLRAALAGLLEDALLDDEADLHLAVSPGWKAGEPGWVAATGKAWLKAQLDALEATGLSVDRLVPAWAPEGPAAAHVFSPGDGSGNQLAWRDERGPLCLPLAGGGARSVLAELPADTAVHWSASPDCADEAAHLAGDTVEALSEPDFLMAATRSDWNLRQFDLAAQHRGSRMARELVKHFLRDRAWRPVRYGLATLLLVQLVGLNAWAWQQRQALAQQKTAMTTLLQSSFPNVRAVIDAPAQMQKELDLLRAAAGRAGETDLEPLLAAADSAWPASRGPAESIKFEPGKLTLGSPGWSTQEVDGFRARLRPLGLDAEAAPGRLVVSRLAPGAAPLPPGAATPTTPAAPGGMPPAAAAPAGPPAGPAIVPRPAPPRIMPGGGAAGLGGRPLPAQPNGAPNTGDAD
jgi:general secretion pathway protein L